MVSEAAQKYMDQLSDGVPPEDLTAILDRAASNHPDVIKEAVAESSQQAQRAAQEAFGGVTRTQRFALYILLISILAVLAAGAILGAIYNKSDSAAFFSFAGIAIGGITGLYMKSPTSNP